jgi:DNA repair protein RadC
MNNRNEELKKLISECLRERPDSYPIQQLLDQFPTAAALMDVPEQQLISIQGIGMGKARQLTALLKLAKNLTIPTYEQTTIRCPKDVFDLLEPELRYATKKHFT